MTVSQPQPPRVLLVDDNEGDHLLMREAVDVNQVPISLTSFFAGPQALRHLAHDTTFDLIVADINMPIMSGMELLAQLEENPLLTHIPRLLFSSSTRFPASTAATVSAPCLAKPATWSEYAALVRLMHDVVQARGGRAETERHFRNIATRAANGHASGACAPANA